MNTVEQNDSALDRRKMSRLEFAALAEVVDIETRATFSMRMTDIGTGGCFLDTMFPLSVGSRVRVTLGRGRTQFQADGNVVSSQAPLGMGVAFDELTPDQRVALMR